jgi:histidinol-phosphate/aromatic aminotransferase/cobyric acid decarboxylase-like protein/NAD(P)-dependent dehydrogenase (short-subunit alcohol dehydrogenase family)
MTASVFIFLLISILIIGAIPYNRHQYSIEFFSTSTTKQTHTQKQKQKQKQTQTQKEKEKVKVFLITGSTRGIGFATAQQVLKDIDTSIVIIHGRTPDSVSAAIKRLKEGLDKKKDRVFGVVADFTIEGETEKLIQYIKKHTFNINVFIHAATPPVSSKSLLEDDDTWRSTMSVHVDTGLYIAKEVIKMQCQTIVFLSSGAVDIHSQRKINGIMIPGSYIIAKQATEKLALLLASETVDKQKTTIITCLQIDATINTKLTEKMNDNADIIKFEPRDVAIALIKLISLPKDDIHGRVIRLTKLIERMISEETSVDHPESSARILANTDMTTFYPGDNNTSENENHLAEYPLNQAPVKLNQAMAHYSGKKVNTNMITVFPGTLAAIDTMLMALGRVQLDGEVIMSDPDWAPLVLFLKKRRMNIVEIARNMNEPNWKDIIKAVNNRTRAIYLTSPDYLTGAKITTSNIKALAQAIPDDIMIIIDQCYADYELKTETKTETDEYEYEYKYELCERYPNIICIRSMSKFMGLAALRVAYTISRKDVAAGLRAQSVAPFLTRSTVSTVITTLQNKDRHQNIRADFEEIARATEDKMRKNNIRYIKWKNGMPHILVELPKGFTWTHWTKAIQKAKQIPMQSELYYDKYVLIPLESTSTLLNILIQASK